MSLSFFLPRPEPDAGGALSGLQLVSDFCYWAVTVNGLLILLEELKSPSVSG